MRCARLCAALISCALATPVAMAQVTSFPYEAIVETDGVPIHSGPGFYATNRLKKGTHVVVQRHDPGGWYMITPPAGEFSLVQSSALRQLGGGMAEIVAEEASARVGSSVAGDFGVEQIPLFQGDRVTLINGVSPPAGWTAIQPPRGEYRWISGRFLVPVLPNDRVDHDADPFAVPSLAKRPESFEEIAVSEEPAMPSANPAGPVLETNPQTMAASDRKGDVASSLRQLDRELEGLTLSEPTDWPLDMLTIEYKRLQSQSPSLSRQIDVRLSQIERMRFVQKQYTDYVQLTSATDERDALLLAGHTSGSRVANYRVATPIQAPLAAAPKPFAVPAGTRVTPIPMAPPSEPASQVSGPVLQAPQVAATTPETPALPTRSLPVSVTPPAMTPRPVAATPAVPATPALPSQSLARIEPQPAVSTQATAPVQPSTPPQGGPQPQRFQAVGVVQKAVDPHPGAPQYVLVSPNGRIVVYLQEPKGVSFEGFIGQSMGVNGEPHRHPQMTTPMIAVDTLTPVRL